MSTTGEIGLNPAHHRHERNVNGIILLDKPSGLSSNDLLQKVKRLFFAKKAGHTGSLDPIATGMLPICLGEATKFSQHLLNSDKHYRVVARLGQRTDTSDAEGRIVCIRPVHLNHVQLHQTLESFLGKRIQIPSMFSALKYKGKPLHQYARQGIVVPRKARLVHIYHLQLLYWDHKRIELDIHCSKGTYIRTIIDDLGEQLGCGAHVIGLRRLALAHYSTTKMVTLHTLLQIAADDSNNSVSKLDRLLLPMDSAVENMPSVNLPLDISSKVRLGQSIAVEMTIVRQKTIFVRLTEGKNNKFFGIGRVFYPNRLAPYRLINDIAIKRKST